MVARPTSTISQKTTVSTSVPGGQGLSDGISQQLTLLLRELTAVHQRPLVNTQTEGFGSLLSPTSPEVVSPTRDLDTGDASLELGVAEGRFDPVAYSTKQVLRMGQETQFVDVLNKYINKKESEIEKICNAHYQDFVDSMDHVLGLRSETGALREQIKSLDDEILDVGLKTINRGNAVLRHQKILLNIEQTLNVTEKLAHISKIFVRIDEHIANRRFYSALKLLEECSEEQLKPSNIPQLEIVKLYRSRINIVQNNIRLTVLQDMKNWQDSLKEETDRVGILTLEYTRKKNKKLAEVSKDGANKAIQKLIAISSSNMNIGMLVKGADDDEEDKIIESQPGSLAGSTESILGAGGKGSSVATAGPININIDFKPLYQCVHIHDVLGRREEFAQRYEEGRRVQAGLLLNQKIRFENGDLATFAKYLENIAGFFVIEGVVLNSTQNFRSPFSVESLWSNATKRLNDIINESLQNCKDPGLFSDIKGNVEVFIQTMDAYGYDISSLHNILTFILNRYSALMKEICEEQLKKIVEEDAYTPLIVDTQDEFDHIMKGIYTKEDTRTNRLRHVTEWADSLRFPKPVPFTKGFPETCSVIRNFIHRCYEFSDGFVNRSLKADEYVHDCIDDLMTNCLAANLEKKCNAKSISQVVQVLVNIDFYLNIIPEFERLLSSKLPKSRNIDVHLNKAVDSFKSARTVSDNKAHDLINSKIDDFLEDSDYEWNTSNVAKEHSPYLDDLASFLNGAIVSSLIGVPTATRNDVYSTVFKHLTQSLLGLMLSPEVSKISIMAIQNFELDITALEKNALDMGLDTVKTTAIFKEVRQTVTYLLGGSYEAILVQGVREKKFPNVVLSKLEIILEKLKNGTLTSSFSLSGTTDEKQKKKEIETAIAGIRAQESE